jgi:heat shock protein HslJ
VQSKARLLFAAILLTTMTLSACRAREPALGGKTWVLQSHGEPDDLQDILEGTEITATFNTAKGEISGSAGCNGYSGSYEVNGSKLAIGPLAHTEMFCATPEGVMEQEQQYLTVLATAQSYEVQDGQLRVFCSGSQRLIFSAR